MNRRKNERRWDLFVLPWVGILMLISIPLSIPSGAAKSEQQPQVREGLAVLEQLSGQDPAAVERTLRQQEENELRRQKEENRQTAIRERLEELEQGSVWSHFSDYALLGDSRALGFAEYSFLDPTRVLAGIGETIWAVPDKLPDVRALSPSYIYVAYGVNEAEGDSWPTGEDYAASMEERINQLREAAPGAKIIVSSILPVNDKALSASPSLGKIPAYNAALKAMCERIGAVFVDNDELTRLHADTLWEPDGIHQKYGFYPYWAKNLLLGAVAADFDLSGIEQLCAQYYAQ